MTSELVYRRGDVLWRHTYEGVLVLLPATGAQVTLTGSGKDLWAALSEPGSIAQLADRLASIYGAPGERIAADIAPVIEGLRTCGALAISTGQ